MLELLPAVMGQNQGDTLDKWQKHELTCMFLDCERRLEYPELTQKTQRKHTNAPLKVPRLYFFVSVKLLP